MNDNNIDVFSTPIRTIISRIEVESKVTNVGKVKNSFFSQYAITSVHDLDTLAEYLLTGHSITPAYVLFNPLDIDCKTGKPHAAPTSQSTFVSQQIFGCDLDNHKTEILKNGTVKYPEGVDLSLTLTNIQDFCSSHQLRPFLIYETMGSADDCQRFRVLFCTPNPVTDPIQRPNYVKAIRDLFAARFRYTDSTVTDLARFFYGTTRNEDNHYYFEDVYCDLEHIVSQSLNEDTLPTDLDNNKYIRSKDQGQYLTCLESLSTPIESNGDIFHQAAQVPFELFSHHSIAEEHFRCDCGDHIDNAPSAHIYRDKKGEYRYHCFGCGADMSGVDYIMMTKQLTIFEALGIVLKSRLEVKPLRKLRQGIKRLRKDNEMAYNRLYFYANAGAYLLQVSIDIAESGYVEGNEVIFIAPATLIKRKLEGIWIEREEDSIRRTMKKLCFYQGFIRHVSDSELRGRYPKMLDYLKQLQGQCNTHCSVYAMPLNRSFDECLQICLKNEDSRRISGATGPVTQDSAKLQDADVHASLYQTSRGVSEPMLRLLKKFRPVLRQCREELNYASRELVLRYCGESTKFAERKLREAWPRLLQDEGLTEIRVNGPNRLAYGLPDTLDSNSKIAVPKEGVRDGELLKFPLPKIVETIPANSLEAVNHAARMRLRARIQLAVAERSEADYWERKYKHMPEPVVAVIEPICPGSKSVVVTKRRVATC